MDRRNASAHSQISSWITTSLTAALLVAGCKAGEGGPGTGGGSGDSAEESSAEARRRPRPLPTPTATATPTSAVPASPSDSNNLMEDPGFESGMSNFEQNQSSTSVALTQSDPLSGAQSLLVNIGGYGDSVLWNGRELSGWPNRRSASFSISMRIYVTHASSSQIGICGLVNYATGSGVTTCREISASAGDKGVVTHDMTLDDTRDLERVRIGIFQVGSQALQAVKIDEVSAVLAGITPPPPGSTPPPNPTPTSTAEPEPEPEPTASPTPSAYPGFTYNLPTARPFISVDAYMRPTTAAFNRFKASVDSAVAGSPGYDYSAVDSVLMYRITNQPQYINDAINRVERFVVAAENRIALGEAPALAGDSYLEIGWYLEQLAMTYDAGHDRLSSTQRERWAALAEQSLYNLWNPSRAQWGGVSRTWTGWSINNPGNNYHYSFLRATMFWALASQNMSWFSFLQTRKFGPLIDYYVNLDGGGSREGTGYGTAQKNLFENYLIWGRSTGEDLAALTNHARDTIEYWVHATVPTRDRFAPIGDQSRSSIPELYDYHENLVHSAVTLSPGTTAARHGTWWLQNNSVDRTQNSANYKGDLLPYDDAPLMPTDLAYHATGVGHFFARSSWNTDATWIAFSAGPYEESHAHQDQGAFTLFRRDWLAVTSNIWSNSGINQDTGVHNVLRFQRGSGTVIEQNTSTRVKSSMTYTSTNGVTSVQANLSNAYSRNRSLVGNWIRNLELQGNTLRVHDVCTVAADVQAVFQLNVPNQPVQQADGSISAGDLRVLPLLPVTATFVSMHDEVSTDFNAGWRIELRSNAGCEFHVELQAQ